MVAANKKQAKDPRYSTSMTGDVRPGETVKQAAKFGNKLDKHGIPPLLREEDTATQLKSTIVSLVKQTEDAKILARVLNTLKSSGLPDKLRAAFSTDKDASKLTDKLASTIVNMEGSAEEKLAFAENYSKGFVDTKKLLDGKLHSFNELIKDRFALEVFKTFGIALTAQGVGPGEIALAILSPKVSHSGRKTGGGDVMIDGKPIEIKTKVSNGGRWVDARKAKLNLAPIKKVILEKTGIEIPDRLSIPAWTDNVRPAIKNSADLNEIVRTIATGNFAFANTANIEKALKTGDMAQIKDAWASTGYENYKAYAQFDGMLLMDAGGDWSAQYFKDFDSMRNNVSIKTVYLYAPESEAMPQVELLVKGAPVQSKGRAAAPTVAAPDKTIPAQPSPGERAKRSDWHKAYKGKPKSDAVTDRKKR